MYWYKIIRERGGVVVGRLTPDKINKNLKPICIGKLQK